MPALVPPKIPDGEKVDFDVSTLFHFIVHHISFNYCSIHFLNLFTTAILLCGVVLVSSNAANAFAIQTCFNCHANKSL